MQDKRERYLSLMGIDTYQLRQPEETPADVVMVDEPEPAKSDSAEYLKEQPEVLVETEGETIQDKTTSVSTETSSNSYMGLRYITSAPMNGLVVVLPSVSKQLNPEARQLMSKMLNSINCKPSETGFAEAGTETMSDTIPAEGIKALLIMDYGTGKEFIDQNNAERVPGADFCLLGELAVVVSIHPQELVTTPELKAAAWRDLKLIATRLNNQN